MNPKNIISVIVGATLSMVYILDKLDIFNADNAFSYISMVSGAFFIVYFLWDAWIWKMKMVQKLPFVPPNLNGAWRIKILSEYEDGDGKKIEKIAQLIIKQNSSKVSMLKMSTDISQSSLDAYKARVFKDNEEWKLGYFYFNESIFSERKSSPVHRGAAYLTVYKDSRSFEGTYWTDRDTHGVIKSL